MSVPLFVRALNLNDGNVRIDRRNRREFFTRAGSGLAGIALSQLLQQDASAATTDPLAPKNPPIAPRAKSVIWCFMEGGPSQIDLFDPKRLIGDRTTDGHGTKLLNATLRNLGMKFEKRAVVPATQFNFV